MDKRREIIFRDNPQNYNLQKCGICGKGLICEDWDGGWWKLQDRFDGMYLCSQHFFSFKKKWDKWRKKYGVNGTLAKGLLLKFWLSQDEYYKKRKEQVEIMFEKDIECFKKWKNKLIIKK